MKLNFILFPMLSKKSEQPVNDQITKLYCIINKTSATNMDRNDIDKITSSMLEKKLIYDKPSKKGTSYYVMEQMNDDIDNNTDNTNDDRIANIRQFTGTYPKYFRKR